jgi:hypothetical protein
MWEGASHRRAEADLLYFADEAHDLEDGQPLVLVEYKTPGKKPGSGAGQARSYAYWVKPAYYLITDGDSLTVWNYQGGAVPDVRVIEVRRTDLPTGSTIFTACSTQKLPQPPARRKSTGLPRNDYLQGAGSTPQIIGIPDHSGCTS